ncbi:MAG: FtsX-like permease family protein [Planctomycetota bacterium]|nr:MAG: FtsX-like permease family protein [Planctomycetota bacterium]
MFVFEIILLGLRNLRLHMLRSILTALGIILGVTAVITMVSIGEGSKQQALEQIERLGARNVIVRSIKPPETQTAGGGRQQSWASKYGLTRDDLDVLRANFEPTGCTIVPLKAVGGQVLRADRRQTSQAYGVTPALKDLAGLRVARGRYLTQDDLDARAMVAVVGAELARALFPDVDPLGSTFRIDDKVVRVVGVLAPVGLSGGAGGALVGRDLNFDVHIPFTTAQTVFGDLVIRGSSGSRDITEVQVHEIYIESPTRGRVPVDAARLARLIETRHPEMDDVSMIVPFELLENARKSAMTWNLVLGAVAGISLLVGGIGIMNIMLASVTERTREIGIRRAIGATRRHIVSQFLVETGVLSVIGGLIGIALGVGLSIGVETIVPILPDLPGVGSLFEAGLNLPTAVTGWSIALSFSIATATGLVFGIYPAIVAARQDPIVALRHD